MIILSEHRHDSAMSSEKMPPEITQNLNKILTHQFLTIMLEKQNVGDFSGGTAASQFRSFLTERYSSALSNKEIFFSL